MDLESVVGDTKAGNDPVEKKTATDYVMEDEE